MTREKFLTVRWNNRFSLGLGIPALMYAVFALFTSVLSPFTEFTTLVIIGVLYWVVVETHTNMRFAWQRKNSSNKDSAKRGFTHPLNLVMIAYNVVWWIPIILTFTKTIGYNTGFIAFFVITVIRLVANLIRNNVLKPEQGEDFPLRSPWKAETSP